MPQCVYCGFPSFRVFVYFDSSSKNSKKWRKVTFRTFALLAKCPLFIILCHAILFTFVASNNQSLVYSALFWLQPFLKNLGSITFWKHEEEEDRKEKGEREWKSKGIACVNKCTLFSFDAKKSYSSFSSGSFCEPRLEPEE